MQQINIYPPSTCLEIWLNEPRRAQNSRAPANLEIRGIESKEVVQRRGILFLKEGTLDEAIPRYQSWKEASGRDLSINEI
ncbi:MAG: hypothetical protein CME16_02840 [Gemmatimonadetes bacterium]|nr:hypothetical protein [Gemmatimonadota bacterium]